MRVVYKKYGPDEEIPVRNILKNKKMFKYYNRETSAGMVCLAELLQSVALGPETPAYYDTGIIGYENFGLDAIAEVSAEFGKFSQQAFIDRGMSSISPLTQFKILLNMPLCFFSIEHGLNGDNAVVYSSATGLLEHGLLSGCEGDVLLGAGKVNADGSVESGFALINPKEIAGLEGEYEGMEGIDIFRKLSSGGNDA